MLISEIFESVIDEAATDVLYHYTNMSAAYEILTTGVFELSSVVGSSYESVFAPKGYNYFMSTSRSKVGGYHEYVGSSAVMFVLDGRKISNNYPVKAVDYWGNLPGKHGESEDRVFSREPSIPADSIQSVHVLVKEQLSDRRAIWARRMFIAAKTKNIPLYLYDDEKAWRLQDTRKSIPIKSIMSHLKTEPEEPRSNYLRKDYLKTWLEIIMKPKDQPLTPEGRKLAYNLKYDYHGPHSFRGSDMINGFSSDMSNARKPGNSDRPTMIKIAAAMKKLKLNTATDVIEYLADKYNEDRIRS